MVEWKKICQISSNVFAGGTPNTKHKEFYDGEIPWIRSGEIDFNVITSAQRNITQAGLTNSSAKLIRKGSVVMAMTGATVAKTAIVDFETAANQSVCAIETNESIANYRFIYYSLANNYFKIKSSAQGALTSLNLAMIKQIKLPIPSLSEQKHIVDILDTFTASIENLNQQIAERRKQFEHYRDTLLDFEGTKEVISWLSFGEDFMLKARIGWQGLTKKEYRKKGAYKLITGTDFTTDNKIAFENCVYVDKERYDQDPYIQIRESDVLITKDGTLGKIAYIEKLDMPATLNGGIFVVRDLTERVKQKFLMYYLTSSVFKDWMKRNHTQGSIKHLTQTLLSKFTIPVIAADKQCAIIEKLDSFTTLISKLEEERDLHQKQYEYYREKLLTFE